MKKDSKKKPGGKSNPAAKPGGRKVHLGKWLVRSAPRGEPLELPSRKSDRGDPFADET